MGFDPRLPKLIAARFPAVRDFEVDYFAERVRPVEYQYGWRKITECPPVARWRVGKQRFSYVLEPTFSVERSVFGDAVRADYRSEDNRLWQMLQWS